MMKQVCLATVLSVSVIGAASADDMPDSQRKAIDKGLEFVARAQSRDGDWAADGWWQSVAMTAQAGMVLLMEGSTTSKGKYSVNVRNAADWLIEHSEANGLIRNKRDTGLAAAKYMEGHGFAMVFLASVYATEEQGKRRDKLKEVLARAVEFCGKSQNDSGGWGYVAAQDKGGDYDAGEVTVSQVQGLAACLQVGAGEPQPIIDKALAYLHKCTTMRGGVIHSLASGKGQEKPALTAAALVCSFSAGQYESDDVKKWLTYCQTSVPLMLDRMPWADLYYYSQATHLLGDDGYERLFPASQKEMRVLWSKRKKVIFAEYLKNHGNDGAWSQDGKYALFRTTLHLTILQLDASTLPIHRRFTPKPK
jgi:hypothetical protein